MQELKLTREPPIQQSTSKLGLSLCELSKIELQLQGRWNQHVVAVDWRFVKYVHWQAADSLQIALQPSTSRLLKLGHAHELQLP